ncbi:MAG: redoxin domain-containing protein [Verrucomicrobia bacterium]|jgi:peroxiredoxin|nr:redoxin domain-containing protein [Verrucomicrobiota bacterium]
MTIRWHHLILPAWLAASGVAAAEPSGARVSPSVKNGLPPDARELRIGDPAPDFSLPGVDGRTYALSDFESARVLMVIFLSNHCPYSHAVEGRLEQLIADTKAEGVAVVAISPNHPEAVRLDELGYSNYNDSFEEMKLYAEARGFTFPYLYDGETQTTAKAYGCLATPHVFIFDGDRRLHYKGRFDDSRFPDPATVQTADARLAVEALLAGRSVPVPETRPMGCSTKWLSLREEVRAVDQRLVDREVTLEAIDADGVKELARNDSDRLRLINVWATWCAPCVQEFPELTQLSRWLANRDFELITISIDDPKDEPKARAFLEKQHAVPSNRLQRLLRKEGRTSTNFIFTGAKVDALAAALDPEWPGPIPYTLVVAPGGRVVFRQAGRLEFDELRQTLLHELGPYYTTDRR